MIFDVAVIIPTILRPELARAVRSVFAQDLDGSVQILIGIDVNKGDAGQLDVLKRECPKNMQITVLDLGYSTSTFNGGLYPVRSGGGLKTILSYAANSRHVAYLDDDNWYAPSHLADLLAAIKDKGWAFSYRWYVDPDTHKPFCIDRWESIGPGRGIYATKFNYNGLVDTNCYMLDKLRCHQVLPFWCVPHEHTRKTENRGGAEDRTLFNILTRSFSFGCTEKATVYYIMARGSSPHTSILHFIKTNTLGDPNTLPKPFPKTAARKVTKKRK